VSCGITSSSFFAGRMKRQPLMGRVVVVVVLFFALVSANSLYELHKELKQLEWVDLTHAFEPGIPHFAAFPDG